MQSWNDQTLIRWVLWQLNGNVPGVSVFPLKINWMYLSPYCSVILYKSRKKVAPFQFVTLVDIIIWDLSDRASSLHIIKDWHCTGHFHLPIHDILSKDIQFCLQIVILLGILKEWVTMWNYFIFCRLCQGKHTHPHTFFKSLGRKSSTHVSP